MINSNNINASCRTNSQIMHDVLDIDTIFDVDTAHIYKSNIHAYPLRYAGVFFMKWGVVSTLKIVNFNSLIY